MTSPTAYDQDSSVTPSTGWRRPLELADVFELRVITDLDLSPDGRRVAYTVRTADRGANRYKSAIWLAERGGGAPQQITAGLCEDAQPRWSPDGRWLAFTSDRGIIPGGKSRPPRNLFVLNIAQAGEALQLTSFDDDVSCETVYPIISEAYAWSPDSRQICLVVKDPWLEGQGPPPAYVYDKLRYKSGEDGWWDGRRKHLWLVSLADGSLRQLTFGDSDDYSPVFSPDGSMIAFLSARNFADEQRNTLPDTNPYAPRDIWLVPADGGELRCLTDSDGPQLSPAFSPDGHMVAYFGHRERYGAWDTPAHLWTRPVSGGEPRDLLEGWDYPVGSQILCDTLGILAPPAAAWSLHGETLYFLGTENGASNLYSVSAGGGLPLPITSGDQTVVMASFDRARQSFAALIQDDTSPPEVYVGEVGGAFQRVTGVNDQILDKVYTAQAERMTYKAADGVSLGGLILKPQGFDPEKRYPLVVELQGGMQFLHGRAFFFEGQLLASRGYIVFFFNPRRQGYPPGWIDQCHQDVMSAIDHFTLEGWVDPGRLGVTGGGAGGHLTNWIIGHTDRFSASVARRAASNNLSSIGDRTGTATPPAAQLPAAKYRDAIRAIESSPINFVDRVTTPHMVIHAEGDPRTPVAQSEEFFVALRSLGKTARLVVFRGEAHFLRLGAVPEHRVAFLNHIVEWLDRYLLD